MKTPLGERYRKYLVMLHNRFGTDQFFWGSFVDAWYSARCKVFSWKLEIPMSAVLDIVDHDIWWRLLEGQDEGVTGLYRGAAFPSGSAEILIRFPVDPAWVKEKRLIEEQSYRKAKAELALRASHL